MDKKDYIQFLDSYMKGNTSEEEEKRLFDWFGTHESEDEVQSLYEERWKNASDTLDNEVQCRMLSNIRSQIDDRTQKRLYARKRFKLYVAAACTLVAVTLGTFFLAHDGLHPTREFVVATGKAQKTSIRLPDGTIAWLNSGSRLTYNSRYNRRNRQVTLEGEAYFNVAKSKHHRFIVSAGDLEIEALGTSFNVKTYSGEENTLVSLVEGKLKISTTETEALMMPNERLTFNKQDKGITVSHGVNVRNDALWRNNELVFNGESLEEIARTLTRMYDVEVVFTSETAKRHTFSGKIKNNHLGNVLELISLTAPIQYMITDHVVEISDK